MNKEEIAEFADNNYEMTINQTTRVTLNEGGVLYGFFKRLSEAGTLDKLRQQNKWEFVVLPQEHLPPKASIIEGDNIISLEVVENILF